MATTSYLGLTLTTDGDTAGWGETERANWEAVDAELARIADIIDATPSEANPVKAAYPVGSIFISTVATDPATQLGFGTWSAFAEGRCIVGVGTADGTAWTSEQQRGAVERTLAESQLPAHSHGVGGVSVASGGLHTHGPGSLSASSNIDITSAVAVNMVAYQNSTGAGQNYAFALSNSTGVNDPLAILGSNADHSHDMSGLTASDGSHTHTLSGSTDDAGGDGSFNVLQPSIGVYMWKRTA